MKQDEEAAANAAMAWYHQQITKAAMEHVAQALDVEKVTDPTTLKISLIQQSKRQ